MFALFFGAGNLILPPQLGFRSGELWWPVALGFCLSAVLIPVLGILAHAKLQGTMFDFGKEVSPTFSLIYCYLVYAISIALPSARTASVTHEMAVAPFFHSPAWLTSLVYFMFVFLFTMNRSRILDLIGKWLTPIILTVLVLIIILSLTSFHPSDVHHLTGSFSQGILEGYQTFDAIGAVVVGGVILVSVNLKENKASYSQKKSLIGMAAWLSGTALFLIYTGLIYSGSLFQGEFDPSISRTALLAEMGTSTLGLAANAFLSLLVSLACFTTAVGIVTGTADFVKSRFPAAPFAYGLTASIGCLTGVLMGQFPVAAIIVYALPALMFIYPLTIVLILMNVVPRRYAAPRIFRVVVVTTLLFSIPDFLNSMGFDLGNVVQYIPLSSYGIGWVLPALASFLFGNLLRSHSKGN